MTEQFKTWKTRKTMERKGDSPHSNSSLGGGQEGIKKLQEQSKPGSSGDNRLATGDIQNSHKP